MIFPGAMAAQPTEAEAGAVIAAMAGVSGSRRVAINDLVRRLKASGAWSKRDLIYVLAAHNQAAALVNWRTPGTYDLTVVGTPVFVADHGAQGNEAWNLATGWAPADVAGAKYVRNDANVKVYSRSPNVDSGDTWHEFGNLMTFMRLGMTTGLSTRMQTSTSDTTTPNNISSGMWEMDRSNASNYDIRLDGALVRTVSRGSQALAAGATFNILQHSSTGGRTGRMLAFFAAGGALSLAESQAENEAVEAYLATLGATGAYEIDDGDTIRTAAGNAYVVYRTTDPAVKPYSIKDRGRGEWRFKVVNGDLRASTTRERSELVGTDLYPWGSDVWIGLERYIEHIALGVNDVIGGQLHDSPNSNKGPPFDLQIDDQRRELVRYSYKLTGSADQDFEVVAREELELGVWVKWVVHFRAGLAVFSETGRLEVWRWGAADTSYVKVADYSGDLGYQEFPGSVKFQFGIYSQGTNGAPSTDDGTDSVRALRYRNVSIGTTPLSV